MDGMIAAASAHLSSGDAHAPAPPSRNQDGCCASLADFADSFPLVPLAAIPRLGAEDLQRLARALQALLASLPRAEDAPLAKYAARQLSLVLRQREQLRAEARVRALVAGEASAPPLPPLLAEPAPALQPSEPHIAPAAGLAAPWSGLRSKKEALERAKALVRASSARRSAAPTASAFVVAADGGGGKKRRRPAKKLTPEEAAERKVRQLEREREARRQAAYQRLLARQELQAKKKEQQEREHGGLRIRDGAAASARAAPPRAGSWPASGTKSESESESESESDASEVSHLSERDAEDEERIMAMEVATARSVECEDDDDGSGGGGGDHSTEDRDGGEREADGVMDEDSRGATGVVTGSPSSSASCLSLPATPPRREVPIFLRPSESDGCLSCAIAAADADAPRRKSQTVDDDEQQQREAFSLGLQQFVAARAAAKLQELQASSARHRVLAYDGVKLPEAPPQLTGCERKLGVESPAKGSASSPHTAAVPRLAIPSAVTTKCRDYRSYFGSFQCILTSAFEQRVATELPSNSRESLLAAPASQPTHDTSLRLQLKLYQGWQSIMQDYATVFGASIATPSCMLPSASPFTAHYRINSTTRREVCEIVTSALGKLGNWEEHASGLGLKTTWNLLWTWSKPRVERKTLLAWQKVNHFQHAKALTRKDCLKKNIGKYLAMGGRMKQAYESFVPKTFLLPQEYVAFVQAFQARGAALASGARNIWIMKPVALSRGRGISLVSDLSDVVYGEQVVIQEYVANPLLLDGFKFDLRLYVLVTSFNPLEAFFYEDGFVRVCTRPYCDGDLGDLLVHLTNSSIQKENQAAISASDNPINEADDLDAGGTKMALSYLWKRLAAMGADVDKVRRDIDEVVLKSLLCGEDHIPFQVNSFDLLGYDILLDDAFRPWLIEINASPSMARENALDYQIKDALILDTIRLVNPLHFDRAALVEVLARRLYELDSAAKRPHAHLRHPKEAEELAARQLNEDLTAILHGAVPRSYGELPEHMGRYRRLCPHSTAYNQLVRLKKSCVRMERRVGGGGG